MRQNYQTTTERIACALVVLVVLVAVLGAVVAVASTGTVSAQSDEVNQTAEDFEDNRPPERIKSVSEDAYISSHEWVDGAVELTVVARTDGVEVTVEDGMSEWDADADGVVERYTLQEGENDIRLTGVGTLKVENTANEYYGVFVRDLSRGSRGAVVGTVRSMWSPPMPSAGATFWLVALGISAFAGVGGAVVSRYMDKIKKMKNLKVKRW